MPGARGFVLRGIVCVALVLFPAAGGCAEEAESITVKAMLPADRGPLDLQVQYWPSGLVVEDGDVVPDGAIYSPIVRLWASLRNATTFEKISNTFTRASHTYVEVKRDEFEEVAAKIRERTQGFKPLKVFLIVRWEESGREHCAAVWFCGVDSLNMTRVGGYEVKTPLTKEDGVWKRDVTLDEHPVMMAIFSGKWTQLGVPLDLPKPMFRPPSAREEMKEASIEKKAAVVKQFFDCVQQKRIDDVRGLCTPGFLREGREDVDATIKWLKAKIAPAGDGKVYMVWYNLSDKEREDGKYEAAGTVMFQRKEPPPRNVRTEILPSRFVLAPDGKGGYLIDRWELEPKPPSQP